MDETVFQLLCNQTATHCASSDVVGELPAWMTQALREIAAREEDVTLGRRLKAVEDQLRKTCDKDAGEAALSSPETCQGLLHSVLTSCMEGVWLGVLCRASWQGQLSRVGRRSLHAGAR